MYDRIMNLMRIQAGSLRPGGRYIIHARADKDITDDAAAQIVSEIIDRGFAVNSYTISGRDIYIDVEVPEYTAKAVPTSAVTGWLPEIFAMTGLVLTMVSIYEIFKSVPEWVVIMLLAGIAMLVVSSNVMSISLPKIEYKGRRIPRGGKE